VTTLAYRAGVLAADSALTTSSEAGGDRLSECVKLHRKRSAVIGLYGESGPDLAFLEWYGSRRRPPQELQTADFGAVVLTPRGLFHYDGWCRAEILSGEFYAWGSGAKAALGALWAGCSAQRAVEIACQVDPFSRPPVLAWTLEAKRS